MCRLVVQPYLLYQILWLSFWLIILHKDGIVDFSYLAVLVVGTITFLPDRILLFSLNANIFLYAGCFKIFLAKFSAIVCLLSSKGTLSSLAKLLEYSLFACLPRIIKKLIFCNFSILFFNSFVIEKIQTYYYWHTTIDATA